MNQIAINGETKRQENMGFLLSDAARLLRRRFNRLLQEEGIGLTQTQWRTLLILSRCQGISQKTLADILEMQPISVSRLIDRMQSAGWVRRDYDPVDRRAVRLSVTEQGQPFLERMQIYVTQTLDIALAGVAIEEREATLKVLEIMRTNLCAFNG